MKDKYKASKAFKVMSEALKPKGGVLRDQAAFLAKVVDKSARTLHGYAANPDAANYRIPPIDVLDRMLDKIMHEDVHRPATLRGLASKDSYMVTSLALDDYLVALDLADRMRVKVGTKGDAAIPAFSGAARLRHQWRQVYFGGVVERADLAAIAGVDYYDVAWVGREHPTLGIQPTFDQVQAAIALEAITSGRAAA